jgi:hypothetical protein
MHKFFRSDLLNVNLQGRQIAQRIRLAKNNLSVVVPAAPAIGNRFLAKLAPVWIEIIATIRAVIGASIS